MLAFNCAPSADILTFYSAEILPDHVWSSLITRLFLFTQELGLEGKTVMALTRTDRVSPAEFQELVLDRITMKSSEFPKPLFACIAVMNRTSEDEVSLQEHQAIEVEWFEVCVCVCV